MRQMKRAAAVCRIFGEGQKVTAAVIELDESVKNHEIKAEDFEVEGRTVLQAYTSDTGLEEERSDAGKYIILELDPKDKEAGTKYMIGKGRDARTGIKRPVLKIRYIPEDITIQSTEVRDNLADKFRLFRYRISDEKYLDYQLYAPENQEEGKKYPLVLFMHDMGACSDDKLAPLAQGNGAVTWTEERSQKKRPCFVLAPCYPRKTANDEYQVTWEADATADLIKELCKKYPVDPARIYGTGQSMGCMMLCELNLRYPELFAGSFMVAGQWNPERMGAVKNQNLWILVSERDEKAFPIMGACMESVEKNGGTVVRGHIDAKAPVEAQNDALREIRKNDSRIYFTWFEGESVLPEEGPAFPGAFHINTWVHAYNLEAIQEWLFSCGK